MGFSQYAGMVMVCDGTEAARRGRPVAPTIPTARAPAIRLLPPPRPAGYFVTLR